MNRVKLIAVNSAQVVLVTGILVATVSALVVIVMIVTGNPVPSPTNLDIYF
jgi:hypothetical protein